eukprot:4177795-Amphidinium_carterae.1
MKWTTFIDNFEGCIRSNVAQVAAMPHYSALPSPHRSAHRSGARTQGNGRKIPTLTCLVLASLKPAAQ